MLYILATILFAPTCSLAIVRVYTCFGFCRCYISRHSRCTWHTWGRTQTEKFGTVLKCIVLISIVVFDYKTCIVTWWTVLKMAPIQPLWWLCSYARKQLLLSVCLSHHNSVSVHPSVRLSVTRVDQSKMVQARITKFSPSAAWKTLVSGTVKLFHKFEGSHPERES